MRNASRQPGNIVIDRYLPNATDAEREQARRELRGFAVAVFEVHERIARERHDAVPSADSRES